MSMPETHSTSSAAADVEEENYLARMYAIHDRDKVELISVKLENRTTLPASPETHMLPVEAFSFVVHFDNFGRRSARFDIRMTEEMSQALIAEYPEEADVLTAALSELASLGQRLYDEASRRASVWEKFRTRGRRMWR